MARFMVAQGWVPDDEFADAAKVIEARDARDAAEKYLETEHSNLDYCAECTLRVRDGTTGIHTRWEVEAISVVQGYASPAKEKGSGSAS